MRLIDSDSLHKSFEEVYGHPDSMLRDSAWWFFGRLEDEPTVDVAPVVHGRWVYSEKYGNLITHKCNLCGQTMTIGLESDLKNFCPNCGAKMDLPEAGE